MSSVMHEMLTDEVLELAALYTSGGMEPELAAEFEHHLGAGCQVCQAEVRAFTETASMLTLAVPEEKPRPQLRDRLMGRLAEESPERVLVRAEEGKWRTWAPGILVKRLFVDRITGAITQLVKVAPGAIYPAHRHGGLEQIFVIDGDVSFDDHELGDGDYEASAATSEHSPVTTREGCLLLIINNMSDELLK